jgi:putative endonuclease
MVYVYALKSLARNYIYVGQTKNVITRFHQHNNGEEKNTRYYAPFELVFSMECKDRSEARKYEMFYKSGRGKEYLKKKKF